MHVSPVNEMSKNNVHFLATQNDCDCSCMALYHFFCLFVFVFLNTHCVY